jgi:hypothetical protein
MIRNNFFIPMLKSKLRESQEPKAHACNSNYPEGRDQEDRGSKSTQKNSLQDPILKKKIRKKGWWSGPEFKPQYQNQKP